MNTELLQQVIDQQADQIEFMSNIIFFTTLAAASFLLCAIVLRNKNRKHIGIAPIIHKREIIIIIGPANSGDTLLRKQLSGDRLTMVVPSYELCHRGWFDSLPENYDSGFDLVIDATYKNEPAVLVRHILMDHVTFHKHGEREPKSVPIKRVLLEIRSDDFYMVKWVHDHQHMFANIYFTHCVEYNQLAETATIFFSTLDPTQSEYQALDTLTIKH